MPVSARPQALGSSSACGCLREKPARSRYRFEPLDPSHCGWSAWVKLQPVALLRCVFTDTQHKLFGVASRGSLPPKFTVCADGGVSESYSVISRSSHWPPEISF